MLIQTNIYGDQFTIWALSVFILFYVHPS